MSIKELNGLNSKQLFEKLEENRRALFGLRLNAMTAHVKDYSQFRKMKKNIAQLLTRIGAAKK